MTKRLLIYLFLFWSLLTLTFYYYTYNITVLFICLGLLFLFGVFTVFRIFLLFSDWKNTSREVKIHTGLLVLLCGLSLCPFYTFWIIEKADWYLMRGARKEIVEELSRVKGSTSDDFRGLTLNLTSAFPPLSDGGRIRIHKNAEEKTITVKFSISEGFLDSPSHWFVYTNDAEMILRIEDQIRKWPEANQKIEENWYRYCGHF